MCWALRQTMEYRVLIERFAGEEDATKDVWIRPGFLSRAVECLQTHLKLTHVENNFHLLGTSLPSWHALPAMARDLAFAPSQMMFHNGRFQSTCKSERDEHLHCCGNHSPISMSTDGTDGLEIRRMMIGAENEFLQQTPYSHGIAGRRIFPTEAIMTMKEFTSFQNTLADGYRRFPPWRLPQANAEERCMGQMTLNSVIEQAVLPDRAGVYSLIRPMQALQIDSRYRARHFELALRQCYETSQYTSTCTTSGSETMNERGRDPQRIRTPLEFYEEYCGSVLDTRPGLPIFGHFQRSIGVESAREPVDHAPIESFRDRSFRDQHPMHVRHPGHAGLVDTSLSTSSVFGSGQGSENGESEVALEEPEAEGSIEDDGHRVLDIRHSSRFQDERFPLQVPLPHDYVRDRFPDVNQNTEHHDLQDEQMHFGDVGDVVVDPAEDEAPTT